MEKLDSNLEISGKILVVGATSWDYMPSVVSLTENMWCMP